MWEEARRGQRGFWVLLPPSAQSMLPGRSGPNFKVGDKKKNREKKKNHSIEVLCIGIPLQFQTRVLSACPRVNCPPSSLDSHRGERCPWDLLPLTREKEEEVRAPSSRCSGSWPAPSCLPPRGPQSASQAAPPLSSLGTQPPDPQLREDAGRAPGSCRGPRCGGWRGDKGGKSLIRKGSGQAREVSRAWSGEGKGQEPGVCPYSNPTPTSFFPRLDRLRVRWEGRGHCGAEAFPGHLLCPLAPAETGEGRVCAASARACLYVTLRVRGLT